MDEPTMGLAPQIVGLILERSAEHHHHAGRKNAVEAIRLSDLVFVLRLGEIVHRRGGSDIDEGLLKALYLCHDL